MCAQVVLDTIAVLLASLIMLEVLNKRQTYRREFYDPATCGDARALLERLQQSRPDFDDFWRRCDANWLHSYHCFLWSVPLFLVTTTLYAWIQFRDNGVAIGISTALCAVAMVCVFFSVQQWKLSGAQAAGTVAVALEAQPHERSADGITLEERMPHGDKESA